MKAYALIEFLMSYPEATVKLSHKGLDNLSDAQVSLGVSTYGRVILITPVNAIALSDDPTAQTELPLQKGSSAAVID